MTVRVRQGPHVVREGEDGGGAGCEGRAAKAGPRTRGAPAFSNILRRRLQHGLPEHP